jgi:transcriptional regulator with XRE-family HTH domain
MAAQSQRVKHASQTVVGSVGLGRRIATSRIDAGIRTQMEFARQLGVTRSAVSEWEKDKSEPSTKNLIRIAELTNKDFDWLATGRTGWSRQNSRAPIDPLANLAFDRITPDTPLRLSVAARVAYPDGSMTAHGLRNEAEKGRLVIERTAGKIYTTLAAITRMRELCRHNPKMATGRDISPTSPEDSCSDANLKRAQEAAYMTLAELEGRSRSTSTVGRPYKRGHERPQSVSRSPSAVRNGPTSRQG